MNHSSKTGVKSMEEKSKNFVERRKGPDLLLKLINVIVFFSWLLIIAILTITAKAGPESATFFDRLLQVDIRNTWDAGLAQYMFYLMLVLLLLCVLGIAFNAARHRRRSDRYRISLFIMGGASVIGIIVYLISFFPS